MIDENTLSPMQKDLFKEYRANGLTEEEIEESLDTWTLMLTIAKAEVDAERKGLEA